MKTEYPPGIVDSEALRLKAGELVSKLLTASGCACCRDDDLWFDTLDELSLLLAVPNWPQYPDCNRK